MLQGSDCQLRGTSLKRKKRREGKINKYTNEDILHFISIKLEQSICHRCTLFKLFVIGNIVAKLDIFLRVCEA